MKKDQLDLPGWTHERGFGGKTDEWITPQWIVRALGEFDLDPCASVRQPWPQAKKSYTELDNGLAKPWEGRVWLNPPYGPATGQWLDRAAKHGNAIALVFARIDVAWFHSAVFQQADGILFMKGRVAFCRPDGSAATGAGSGSVLIAYGAANVEALRRSKIEGHTVSLKSA